MEASVPHGSGNGITIASPNVQVKINIEAPDTPWPNNVDLVFVLKSMPRSNHHAPIYHKVAKPCLTSLLLALTLFSLLRTLEVQRSSS